MDAKWRHGVLLFHAKAKVRFYAAFFSSGLTPVLISQTAAQYVDPISKSKFLMLTRQG